MVTDDQSRRRTRLLRIQAVRELTGLCKTTVYELERSGNFPKRVALGARSVAWKEEEVEAWIDARCRKVAA